MDFRQWRSIFCEEAHGRHMAQQGVLQTRVEGVGFFDKVDSRRCFAIRHLCLGLGRLTPPPLLPYRAGRSRKAAVQKLLDTAGHHAGASGGERRKGAWGETDMKEALLIDGLAGHATVGEASLISATELKATRFSHGYIYCLLSGLMN